jgi:hypothetical protein
MVHLLEGGSNSGSPLISNFIKVDERAVNFLLGFDEPDLKIRNYSYIVKPKKSFEDLILPSEFKNRLMNISNWYSEKRYPLKFLFCGPSGNGKKTTAEAFCREAGVNLQIVDSKVFLESQSLETTDLVMREALLQNSALYLQDFGLLLEDTRTKELL